jgi:allophanate hydrolase subunit 2
VIRVVAVHGLALVQDAGRPGHMHEGVPPGGALVPELLAAANAAVGNPWRCAAIEHFGRIDLDGTGVVGTAAGPVTLPASFMPAARVGYVAVPGGIDVPVVLGGRGTLLGAGIGGRALRAGDELRGGEARGGAPTAGASDGPIRVVPGPDLDRLADDALPVLQGGPFTVSPLGDRVGIRLAGARIGVRVVAGPSAPMVRGAIQVPPSGELIVLGPDHPTTGGYPVVAVVGRADFGRFAALRPGSPVGFTAISAEELRRTAPGWSR